MKQMVEKASCCGRLRLREDVQDEEADDAVPFPWSGEVDGAHGDGCGRRRLR
jgi:hypothetical protein